MATLAGWIALRDLHNAESWWELMERQGVEAAVQDSTPKGVDDE